jgi:hypothetical protein
VFEVGHHSAREAAEVQATVAREATVLRGEDGLDQRLGDVFDGNVGPVLARDLA